jgi:hypothetical protein
MRYREIHERSEIDTIVPPIPYRMQDIVEEDLKAFRTNMKSVSGHKDFQPF